MGNKVIRLFYAIVLIASSFGSIPPLTGVRAAAAWTQKHSMPVGRAYGGSAVLNGKLYMAGGTNWTHYPGVIPEFVAYDPTTDAWTSLADFPGTVENEAHPSAVNGLLYVLGGGSASVLNTMYKYDPGTNQWSTLSQMPHPRRAMGAAAFNNKIYYFGGVDFTTNSVSDMVQIYDTETDTWSTGATMSSKRSTNAALWNNKIYVIGGANAQWEGLDTVEMYDPVTDTWQAGLAPMPTPQDAMQSTTLAYDGKIYLVGGCIFNPACTMIDTVEAYDVASNTWETLPSYPYPMNSAQGGIINGVLYVAGGYAYGPFYDAMYSLDLGNAGYSISGHVTDSAAANLGGATITASSGGSTTTDANGNFTLNFLSSGSYTLTPSKNGYTFDPPSRTVTVGPNASGQDFTGNPVVSFFSISGQITASNGGTPMAGVVISAGGGYSATTGSGGSYSLPGLPAGTYTLTPAEAGFSFTPLQRTVTVGPSATGQDFQGSPNETLVVRADTGFNSIHLHWDPANYAGVTDYQIQRASPTAQSTYSSLDTTTGLDYFDSFGLVEGQNYCYKVNALAGTGVVATSDPACAIYGQINLWVPEMYGIHGDTNLIVPINIRNATGLQIASADIWLEYDPTVITCTDVTNTAMSIDFQWQFNCATPGLVKISTFASPPKSILGDGSLFWLTFSVVGQAGDNTPVTFKPFVTGTGGSTIYTDPGDGIPEEGLLVLTSGTLNVEATGKLGDVTDDGIVNSADAYMALQISVGRLTPTYKQRYTADVNGDGAINSADVSMILYYAVNQTWPLPPESSGLRATGATALVTTVSLDRVSGNPGDTVTTVLRVSNLQQSAGGDFVITFNPLLVTNVTGVTATGLAGASPLQFKYSSDGSLRISIARSTSISGTGALANITLKLAANPVVNSSPLVLAGVRLHDPFGRDFELSALQGTVQRQNGQVELNYLVFLPFIGR